MTAQVHLGTCQACGVSVGVQWADGVPLPSDEVHIMYSLLGEPPLVLHACEHDEGSERTPEILFARGASA